MPDPVPMTPIRAAAIISIVLACLGVLILGPKLMAMAVLPRSVIVVVVFSVIATLVVLGRPRADGS